MGKYLNQGMERGQCLERPRMVTNDCQQLVELLVGGVALSVETERALLQAGRDSPPGEQERLFGFLLRPQLGTIRSV